MPAPHLSNAFLLDADEGLILDGGINVYQDGTTTLVQILDPDNPDVYLSEGVARRRKGDRRNPAVGRALAISRALRDLADRYEGLAEEFLA